MRRRVLITPIPSDYKSTRPLGLAPLCVRPICVGCPPYLESTVGSRVDLLYWVKDENEFSNGVGSENAWLPKTL
jgi:hypothetical protein